MNEWNEGREIGRRKMSTQVTRRKKKKKKNMNLSTTETERKERRM